MKINAWRPVCRNAPPPPSPTISEILDPSLIIYIAIYILLGVIGTLLNLLNFCCDKFIVQIVLKRKYNFEIMLW